jgi:hypothetical protein
MRQEKNLFLLFLYQPGTRLARVLLCHPGVLTFVKINSYFSYIFQMVFIFIFNITNLLKTYIICLA